MSRHVHRPKGKPPVEVEAPARPQKRGQRKPWSVEYRTRWRWGREWGRHGRYTTEERACQALAIQAKKARGWLRWDYRLVNPDGEVMETILAPRETP